MCAHILCNSRFFCLKTILYVHVEARVLRIGWQHSSMHDTLFSALEWKRKPILNQSMRELHASKENTTDFQQVEKREINLSHLEWSRISANFIRNRTNTIILNAGSLLHGFSLLSEKQFTWKGFCTDPQERREKI